MHDRSGSRARRWLFGGVVAVAVALAIEGLSFALFRVVAGRSFSFEALREERAAARLAGEAQAERGRPPLPTYVANKALHPYVGYVVDRRGGDGVSSFGYLDEADPIRHRADDRLIVGVLGGSVAMGFTRSPSAQRIFAERLAASEAFATRRLELVRLAISGYHQPQQLMTLSYLLALGAEFDLLINVDGFNEVALHPAENARFGVFPAYPRAWYLHTAGLPLRVSDDYRYALVQRRRFAEHVSGSWLERSVTANLVWWLVDRRLAREVAEERERLIQRAGARGPFAATGPRREYANPRAMMEDLVLLWKRSSLQMAKLCRENGIRYYHFLQPNQYVPGSKRLAPAELARAFDPRHPFREGAVLGYPLLREAGAALARAGVRFTDLSQVFAAHVEPLYIDTCCHFNEDGFAIIAEAIADAIVRDAE